MYPTERVIICSEFQNIPHSEYSLKFTNNLYLTKIHLYTTENKVCYKETIHGEIIYLTKEEGLLKYNDRIIRDNIIKNLSDTIITAYSKKRKLN